MEDKQARVYLGEQLGRNRVGELSWKVMRQQSTPSGDLTVNTQV